MYRIRAFVNEEKDYADTKEKEFIQRTGSSLSMMYKPPPKDNVILLIE